MNNKTKLIILFLGILTWSGAFSFLFSLNPVTSIDKYIHHTWTTRDGLPQNTIHCIAQDKKGYIWLGTDRGLVLFDGASFRVFDSSGVSAIKNNAITSLFVAEDGTLWIGTSGGGVTSYKDRQFKNFSIENGLTNNFINSITQDSYKNIWVGTTGEGVFKYNGKRFTYIPDTRGLAYNIATSVFCDSSGRIWVGTEKGLNRFDDKNDMKQPFVLNFQEKNGLAGDNILCVSEDGRGHLWIGTTNGLTRVKIRTEDPANWVFTKITRQEGLLDNMIKAILEDKDGNIWIATNGGLNKLRLGKTEKNILPQNIERYTAADGLSDNALTSIYEDKWGNIWVGTSGGGLNMFREGRFTFYTEKDGLSVGYVKTVYEDKNKTLWIGTSGGGLNYRKDGKFGSFTQKDGLSSNYIEALSADRSGNLWIGTASGLNCLKDGKITVYTTKNGLSNNSIRSIYEDNDGNLWIGTYGGGLNLFTNGTFKVYDTSKGLSDNFILSLSGDLYGNIWIGTIKGLNCFDRSLFRRFPGGENVPVGMIQDIYSDKNGVIWLATNNEGLIRYEKGVFIRFKSDEGFGNYSIYRILEDESESLWLTTNQGVFSVPRKKLDDFATRKPTGNGNSSSSGKEWLQKMNWKHFLEDDGLKTSVCSGGSQPAGWIDSNRVLWIPTIKGLAAIGLKRVSFSARGDYIPAEMSTKVETRSSYLKVSKDQPVIIEKIVADGIVYLPQRKIILPVDTQSIEFYYTAIIYGDPGNILFKYRLNNYNDAYIVSRSKKSMAYKDLPPGDYRFEVLARPADGEWSYGSNSIGFSIKHPFLHSFWFYFLVSLCLVFLIWGIPKVIEWNRKRKEPQEEKEKYKGSSLTPQKSKTHLNQLLAIMKDEKPYLDPEMSLQQLAMRIGITKEDLSQVINEQLNKNFKNFLNDYRIEEAKRKLENPRENQYVLLKIAFDVGFNSKSSFNAIFKKSTGLSPSEYRKKHQKTEGS